LTEQLYKDYLQGLINKKSEAFKDVTEDNSHLMAAMKDFFNEENGT